MLDRRKDSHKWRTGPSMGRATGAILDVCTAALRTYLQYMAQRRLRRFVGALVHCGVLLLVSCSTDPTQPSPQDALVTVNGVVLDPQYLHEVRQALPAYGRGRFSGPQGQRALLARLIDLELLASQARARGRFSDPRVAWTLKQALAQRQARVIQERMVPRQSIEEDDARLRSFIDTQGLGQAQTRTAFIAVTKTWDQAQRLAMRLREGEAQDEVFASTPGGEGRPMVRDDKRYPVFHRLLFDAQLNPGDWLEGPVMVEGRPVLARLAQIQPATPFDLSDPAQRAQVVDAAIEAPQREALEGYLEGLRRRWPLKKVDPS